MHLLISLNISLIENMFKEETLVETEEDDFQSFIPCTPVYNATHSAEIEKEIDWILYNLILLSSKCHDKVIRFFYEIPHKISFTGLWNYGIPIFK